MKKERDFALMVNPEQMRRLGAAFLDAIPPRGTLFQSADMSAHSEFGHYPKFAPLDKPRGFC